MPSDNRRNSSKTKQYKIQKAKKRPNQKRRPPRATKRVETVDEEDTRQDGLFREPGAVGAGRRSSCEWASEGEAKRGRAPRSQRRRKAAVTGAGCVGIR